MSQEETLDIDKLREHYDIVNRDDSPDLETYLSSLSQTDREILLKVLLEGAVKVEEYFPGSKKKLQVQSLSDNSALTDSGFAEEEYALIAYIVTTLDFETTTARYDTFVRDWWFEQSANVPNLAFPLVPYINKC